MRYRCHSIIVVVIATLGAVVGPGAPSVAVAAPSECGGTHFVASWTTSPSDSLTPIDASGGVIPLRVSDQTFRTVVTPHLSGQRVRVRLSNRFGVTPVTFGAVTVAAALRGARTDKARPVTFRGRPGVSVSAGDDVLSDPLTAPVVAFEPLAVTVFVAGDAGPPTKHWNANATSYYTASGRGNTTRSTSGNPFVHTTKSWFYVTGLDVETSRATKAVVAFGDSITDGFVTQSPLLLPADPRVADTQSRYPDFLQRRLDAAGVPVSVVNAGIGSNRLLTSGEPLMLGPSGLDRFERDALRQPGVGGVLLLEGINDLGLPPFATGAAVIDGLRSSVLRAHRAGVKVWLGTVLPASDALIDGTLLNPASERERQRTNRWIRSQRLADGVVDFDRAMRDPARPATLRRDLSGPDRLHPNVAGYRAMADAVDLAVIAKAVGGCREP